MNYEFFDPTNQSHMEIMNMMMQMEESLPQFSGTDIPQPPSILDFSNGSMTQPAFNPFPDGTAPVTAGSTDDKVAAMREMIFRIAAMQPIHIDPEAVKPPKRRNVKISKDPQSVAARHRRERISEKIRILQRLVPGGMKMDTASMLDEAIHYVKFLKSQVQSLESVEANRRSTTAMAGFSGVATSPLESYWSYDQQQQQEQQQQYMNNAHMLR